MPQEKIEMILTSWDYLLRVWAVVGPLLAGAASAIWARRNLVQDREYQDKESLKKEQRLFEEQEKIRIREIQREKYNELKKACFDYMASSHEYVRKQSEYLTNSTTPLLHDHARAANDRFTASCQIIILLGDDNLSSVAIDFWNATIAIPKSYSIPDDDKYQEKLNAYRKVRSLFDAAAKAQIKLYENSI